MKKKALSLLCAALALTAVLGAGSAASAAFTDSDQIQYKSAVGVTTGTGIVNGYTDGSFRPKDSITREQATKLVTFAAIGEDAVSHLPREATGFSDVPATRWSAPYVNWCRQNGLIDGMGDGTFHPEGPVTGYQLAKMLLRAVGYGQNGEYTNSSWELTATKDGFAKGLFAGIANSNPEKAVSREDAALYIFNMLTRLEKVSYSNGAYVPADGTATLDNTFGASVFGIITDGPKATVYSGIVTGNSANGEKGTTVSGKHYSYETGASYLGHLVTVYTNGKTEPKGRIYYIADESTAVELKSAISDKDFFKTTFGDNIGIASDILVYDETGSLSELKSIPAFDLQTGAAPAGSYVLNAGVITAYIPRFEEFAAVVGETKDGEISIGQKTYPVDSVYCESGGVNCGDIVLAKMIGKTVNIRSAGSFVGELTKAETEKDGTIIYYVLGAELRSTSIRVEGATGSVIPTIGGQYRFYLDSNGDVVAILPAA